MVSKILANPGQWRLHGDAEILQALGITNAR